MSFIDDLKREDEYYCFINRYKLLDTLYSIYDKEKRIVFYFSGHSCEQGFILPCYNPPISLVNPPEQEFLHIDDIVDIITWIVEPSAEILIINDSCYSFDFDLPYYVSDNRISLNNSRREFYSQKIICINSSSINNKSFSTLDGSIFTYNFISMLSKNIKLNTIFNDVYYSQNQSIEGQNLKIYPSIYISFPNIYYIWSWILRKKLNICFNPYSLTFEIKFEYK